MDKKHTVEVILVAALILYLWREWENISSSVKPYVPDFNLLYPPPSGYYSNPSSPNSGIGYPLDANGYPTPYLPAKYVPSYDSEGYPTPYLPNTDNKRYVPSLDASGYPIPYLPPLSVTGALSDNAITGAELPSGGFCPVNPTPNLSDNLDGITGIATYYAPHVAGTGTRTANGEYFDGTQMTAASPYIPGTVKPKYPFDSMVKVTDVKSGNSVVVRINDTGSFGKFYPPRVIDLSPAAMRALTGRLSSTYVRLEQA